METTVSDAIMETTGSYYSQFWLGRNSGDLVKMCLQTEIML